MNYDSWIKLKTHQNEICKNILSISKNIRYVGVFNQYGRTISGKIRPGIKPLFFPNAVREEFFSVSSSIQLREKSSKSLGGFEYMIIHHKKINVLIFHKKNMTYYITAKNTVMFSATLIEKIKRLITRG